MVTRIQFRVDENGEVKLEVFGATGSKCEELTKPFEEVLGLVTERERKDEFYQEETQDETIESKR